MSNEKLDIEDIGQLADKADNLIAISVVPLDPNIHINGMVKGLKEISETIKKYFVESTGENHRLRDILKEYEDRIDRGDFLSPAAIIGEVFDFAMEGYNKALKQDKSKFYRMLNIGETVAPGDQFLIRNPVIHDDNGISGGNLEWVYIERLVGEKLKESHGKARRKV